MSAAREEAALRSALVDLAADQPDQPWDRVSAVRRRHVRRRTVQATATAAATAVAIAVALVGVHAAGGRTAEPLHRSVPSWALPWPDHRNGSVPQRVLDGAVVAWRATGGDRHIVTPLPSPSTIVWYAGQTVADGRAVVAVFEAADGSGGRRLVTATASAADVLTAKRVNDLRAPLPWVVHDVPAPDPRTPPAALGAYARGGDTYDNWVVVLAEASATGLRWSAPGAPGGTAPVRDGLAVFDVGEVRGAVSVVLHDRESRQESGPRNPVLVGLPGNAASQAPQLEPAASPQLNGRRLVAGEGGQGPGAGMDFGLRHSRARLVLLGRCYGPGPTHVTLDDGPLALNVPCDDQQHEFSLGHLRPQPRGHTLFIDADPLTAWSITLARPS
jgi:hypothetical protein